jgi:P-type E1-E2 ATPase
VTSPEVCAEVAAAVGIDEVIAGCTPQRKLEVVRQLQQGGAVVAIVGDGINDAAMLRAGDVSFAMGKGAALAQVSADAVIMSDRLSAVAQCAQMARRTMRIVRQNLGGPASTISSPFRRRPSACSIRGCRRWACRPVRCWWSPMRCA